MVKFLELQVVWWSNVGAVSPGKMPTVVSPELYRARFCEAMDKYFLMVPDHWTSLGINCWAGSWEKHAPSQAHKMGFLGTCDPEAPWTLVQTEQKTGSFHRSRGINPTTWQFLSLETHHRGILLVQLFQRTCWKHLVLWLKFGKQTNECNLN